MKSRDDWAVGCVIVTILGTTVGVVGASCIFLLAIAALF